MSREWLEVISFFKDLRPWIWQCWALTDFRTFNMMIDDDWSLMKDFLSLVSLNFLRTCLSTPARFVIKRLEDDLLRDFKLKLDVLEDWHSTEMDRFVDLAILSSENPKEQTSSYADYTWIKSHRLLDKTKDTIPSYRVIPSEIPWNASRNCWRFQLVCQDVYKARKNVYFAWSQNQWRSWMTMIKNDHDMWKAHPPSLSKYMFVRPFDFLTSVVNWPNMETFLTSQQPTMFSIASSRFGSIYKSNQVFQWCFQIFQMWQFSVFTFGCWCYFCGFNTWKSLKTCRLESLAGDWDVVEAIFGRHFEMMPWTQVANQGNWTYVHIMGCWDACFPFSPIFPNFFS